MSGTIVRRVPAGHGVTAVADAERRPAPQAGNGEQEARDALLVALGDRVRKLRSRRGLTRRSVAQSAGISERYLANLEYGIGNASLVVLQQLAGALHCPLAELIGDVTTSSPEWLLIRELLEGRDEATLRRVRLAVGEVLGTGGASARRSARVALIGLRGAGKSTLGRMLGEDLGFPFVELGREIEKFAGCSVAEIQALYGMNAYRRYERRALEEAVQIYPEAVVAVPGGLVSDPATFNLLLASPQLTDLETAAAAPRGRFTILWSEDGELRTRSYVREGAAMLIEFDYEGKLVPSLPMIEPLQESYFAWLMKYAMLKPAYMAVLKGRV